MNAYEYINTLTNVYQEHENSDISLREAHCLEVIAQGLFLPIEETDLLVGRLRIAEIGFSSEPLFGRSVAWYYDPQRLDSLMSNANFSKSQKQRIGEIKQYWKTQETRGKIRAEFPPHMSQALPQDIYWEHSEIAFPLYRVVDAFLDYNKLLTLGLPGIKAQAQSQQAEMRATGQNDNMFAAMVMAIDSLSALCERYAVQALTLSVQSAPERRGELTNLSKALTAISHRPPQSFLEAMQLAWLYSISAGVLNYGRMDDYLGKFLVGDLNSGAITEEKALLYIRSLWRLIAARKTVFHSRVIIGGEGRVNESDANRFAMLAMQASRIEHDIEPQLSLRFYNGQAPELIEKALACIGEGCTYPILYCDEVNIPAVMSAFEVSKHEATDYMMFGCGEYVLNHRSFGSPNGIINLLKLLECTLSGGSDLLYNGKTVYLPACAIPSANFEQLYSSYMINLRYYVEILAQQEQLEYEICAKAASFLYMSMLFDDCMQRRKAIFDGGAYYLGGTLETYGNVNTINSLFAIKTLVYEQRAITLQELVAAMRVNFHGYEPLRLRLLGVGKYGNDLPDVDAFAQRFHTDLCTMVREQRERTTLHSYLVVIINNEANTILGRFTAASPDGRFAKEPMANANSATGGTDTNGLTSMLNSVASLDTHIHAGAVQNIMFSKELFNGHRSLAKAALKAYFKHGGQQAMITVLDKDDLKRAIERPELYEHIMVRVGGFSAKFVTLSPDVQKEIASRTLY